MDEDLYLKCSCGNEIINFLVMEDFSQDVFISIYSQSYKITFLNKLKLIWRIIIKGTPYNDQVVLRIEDLLKIRKYIDKFKINKGEKKNHEKK